MRFLSRLFRRKPKIIQVSSVAFPEQGAILETSFDQLTKMSKVVFESPVDWFVLGKDGNIYRKLKDQPQPFILPCRDVKLHPDLVGQVFTVDLSWLGLLAARNNATIIMTDTEYLLPTPMGLFRAPKQEEKVK